MDAPSCETPAPQTAPASEAAASAAPCQREVVAAEPAGRRVAAEGRTTRRLLRAAAVSGSPIFLTGFFVEQAAPAPAVAFGTP